MTFLRPFGPNFPGVTSAWLARANGCSVRSIHRWRARPDVESAAVTEFWSSMTVELALEMALLRPRRGVLPFWSRLAIADFAARGATYADLMRMFRVGRSTVYRAIHRPSTAYCSLGGRRQLTQVQAAGLAIGQRQIPHASGTRQNPPFV